MREKLEVTYQNGDVETVIAFYPDFVKFEERFDRNPIVTTFEQYRVTNQGFLAWAALTREGRINTEWETWLNTIENVKILDEDMVHNPLESNQDTGSSPD